jgi:hypothetical protein
MKKPYLPDCGSNQGRDDESLCCATGIVEWIIVALAVWTAALMIFIFLGVI